jgi:branched-chain amino acid transport system substrate-binding protein
MRLCSAIAVIAVLLSAGTARAADIAPLEVPAILSLTGSGAYLGNDEAQGLLMVENAVNATHGIHGRPIKFIVSDDQSSPQVAVQLLTGILQKTPPVVIGSSLVAACKAMAPLMQSGPTLYCLSGTYEPPAGSKIFAYGIPVTNIMRFHLRYFREHRVRRVAAIVTTDATGQDGERAIRQAMALPENSGLSLVDVEHFNPSDVSVTAQMSNIKAANPDLLIAYVAGTPLGTILQARNQLGLNVPISTSAANFNARQMEPLAAMMPEAGFYMAVVPGLVPSAATSAPLKRAIQTYLMEKAKPGIHAEAQSIIGWDSAMISSTILRGLGNAPTGDQFAAELHALHDYYGAAGAYDFRDSQTGLNGNSAVMVRYDGSKHDFAPAPR